VFASLAVVVTAILLGGEIEPARLWPLTAAGPYGILQSAGLLFFAFAGYARLATLGEEVIDPAGTIPRAIPVALGITLLVYAAVAVSALLAVDAAVLARAAAPLAAAVEAGRLASLSPAVRIGATVASLGVLLSLIVGVSRTVFAMAANRDLPGFFAAVHPRYRVPHRAEIGVGILVGTIAALADIRSAIGFSSFAVLTYYAVANASAFTLDASQRRWPRWLAVLGLLGCMVLAFSLPMASVVGGSLLLVAGAVVFWVRSWSR
jgi:APA family basic amino acid/polyamine antiporter